MASDTCHKNPDTQLLSLFLFLVIITHMYVAQLTASLYAAAQPHTNLPLIFSPQS